MQDAQRLSRKRKILRGAVVGIAATAMVVGPAIALDDPRPSFFGWHMYAASVSPYTVDVTRASGTEQLMIGDIAARSRPEVSYPEPAARFLCDQDPTIEKVEFHREYPAVNESYQCATF